MRPAVADRMDRSTRTTDRDVDRTHRDADMIGARASSVTYAPLWWKSAVPHLIAGSSELMTLATVQRFRSAELLMVLSPPPNGSGNQDRLQLRLGA